MRKYQEEVTRGFIQLSKKKPTWYRKVNFKTMDMLDSEACLLYQVYGQYCEGLDKVLKGAPEELNAADFGFDIPLTFDNTYREVQVKEGRLLKKEWKRQYKEKYGEYYVIKAM
jgi:hypothetical protein